jgi:predicted permease
MLRLSHLYPRRLAHQERELRDFWSLALSDARRTRGWRGVIGTACSLLLDLVQAWRDEWHHRPLQPVPSGDSLTMTWFSDVRHSCRSLWRQPGVTLTSVLSLAVGLGGTLAIFAVAHAVLFRPLPFADPSRLVSVQAMVQRDTLEVRAFSVPDYRDYQAAATSVFQDMAAWTTTTLTLRTDGVGVPTPGEMVTGNYFSLLGTAPVLGLPLPDRDVADSSPAIVISERLWERLFNRDAGAIGRTLYGDDQPFTVVGVMPAEFRGLSGTSDVWVPFARHEALVPENLWNNRGARWHSAIGRLQSSATVDSANAALGTVALNLAGAFPQSNTGYTAQAELLSDALFGDVRPQLMILLAAVGVVLFMTCVNVTNLLVARLSARQYEFAVRASLGASRARIVSLAAADGLTLSVLGAMAGAPLTWWLVQVLRRLDPASLPEFAAPALTWPVVWAGVALTVLASVFITAMSMVSLQRGQSDGLVSTRGASDTTRTVRLRRALTTIQVACALALLTTAVLLGLSFRNLANVDAGYRTTHTLIASIDLPASRYEPARRLAAARDLHERLQAIPGARLASLSSDAMLGGGGSASFFAVDIPSADAAASEGRVYVHQVTETFFEAAGIPLLEGETVPRFDGQPLSMTGPDLPVVVSEKLAKRFWPGGSAVGQRMKLGRSDSPRPWMRIIGVVGDTRFRGLPENPTQDPDLYLPFAVRPATSLSLVLHTDVEPLALVDAVQAAVAAVDPLVPLSRHYDIAERITAETAPQRFLSQLSAAFGIVALLLAVVGTYGVVAYQVVLSQRAIGIKLALGAVPRQIFSGVIGGTARLVAVGLLAGAGLAAWAAHLVADQLYAVAGVNAPVIVATAILVSIVALGSAWLPARRAMRVDPASVLRAN